MNWSDKQEAIFSFGQTPEKGSFNVIALAGCAKTTTLVELANRLNTGRTLLTAFNKSIAEELGQKVRNPNCTAATFHSIGFSLWRRIRSRNEVDGRKLRTLAKAIAPLDKHHADVLVDAVEYAKQMGFGIVGQPAIGNSDAWTQLFDHYDLWDEVPSDVSPDRIIAECQKIYNQSIKLAKDEGRIDFSDMILLPLLFSQEKAEMYDTVMIDEAQDTSVTRRLLALHVLKTGGRLIAAGDPNQCIYFFAGSSINSMDLIKDATGAAELSLNITYRCPRSVVELAQTWVPDYTAHESNGDGMVRSIPHTKFWDFANQDWQHSFDPHTDVILCRNTRPLVGIAKRLRKAGIPCIVEGQSGKALLSLAVKWGTDITVEQLGTFLDGYLLAELAKWNDKGRADKAEWTSEKVGILRDMMEDVPNDRPVSALVQHMEMMFGEGQYQNADLLRLCTIHRSKGREWDRVFLIGRNRYQPSKWAKTDAEKQGEKNLMYVAVTRAKEELIEVVVPVPNPKKGGGDPGAEWWEE